MKHLLLILLIFFAGVAGAQKITLSGFSVKPVLAGDINDWKPGDVNAAAQSDVKQGGSEAKLVVTIESGGQILCGNTAQTASLENITVKAISTNTIKGIMDNCQLKPGRYTLCIAFFNADNFPAGDKQCREFTVEEKRNPGEPVNQQGNSTQLERPGQPAVPPATSMPGTITKTYRRPDLVYPANNAKLKPEDLRKPLTLRFTQVVPPAPVNDLLYTVRVYEVLPGQEPSQALKANQPIWEKGVRTTQAIWQVPTEYASTKEAKTFTWNVQATNKEGVGYGDNNGTSENWVFKMLGGGCTGSLKITSDSCIGSDGNGNIKHRICATYTADAGNSCTVLFNNPANSPSNNFGMQQSGQSSIFCSRTSGTTTQNFSPALNSLASSISAGSSVSFCFDLVAPSSVNQAVFNVFGFCNDNTGLFNTANDLDTFVLKKCLCTYCDDKKMKAANLTAVAINNATGYDEIEINADLTYGTGQVSRITAEIVGFEQKINDTICTTCNNANEMHGVFVNPNNNLISPTGSWTNSGKATFYPAGANFSRQAEWSNTSGVNMASAPQHVKLRVGVPDQNRLQCCNDVIRMAIRYSFITNTDNGECRVCEIVSTVCVVRNGKECPKSLSCPQTTGTINSTPAQQGNIQHNK